MRETHTVDHGSPSYDDEDSSEEGDLQDVQMCFSEDESEAGRQQGGGHCVVPHLNLAPRNGGCGERTAGANSSVVPVSHPQVQQHGGAGNGLQPVASTPVVPVSVRGNDLGNTSIAVDLLSNAFRLKHETVQTAKEWGCTLEQVVGNGFSSALDISQRNLHYYVVQEVAWDEIADSCPKHIAVGIEGSSKPKLRQWKTLAAAVGCSAWQGWG